MKQRVSWLRWFFTFAESWVAFVFGLVALAAVYYGCYWVIYNYCPDKYLVYFKWGFYISVITVGLMLIFNEPLVRLVTGAKRIKTRVECPKLWDAVYRVTPWHAKPVPRIYLLPSYGMNAISFGWGLPYFSAVGATSGLLAKLNQQEIEAVMAHEIGHVINKDILISMIMALAVMIVATTGYFLFRMGPFSGDSDRSSSDSKGGGWAVLIAILVGLVMYILGRLLGLILQAFVSRQREYAADATASRLVGTSQTLKSALKKIVANANIGSETIGGAAGFLCTADPEPTDVMATHPPIDKRLRALDDLEKDII